MRELSLGILMIFTGLIGLGATVCGVIFLPQSGLGLIGIIPGALLLWAAVALFKAMRAPPQTAQTKQSLKPQAGVSDGDSIVDHSLLGKCPNCGELVRLIAKE